MSEGKVTLEEHFDHIEDLINRMETEDISLDQSFELYKEGLARVKEAGDMLDSIEKAMLMMNEDGELEEFQ